MCEADHIWLIFCPSPAWPGVQGRLEQSRCDEAEAAYSAGDLHRVRRQLRAGGAYHQPGRVADKQRRFDAAEAAYNTMLQIIIDSPDNRNVAKNRVAQPRQSFADAALVRKYRRLTAR